MSVIREAREMKDEITRLSNLLDWYIKRVDWLEKQLASAHDVLKIIGRQPPDVKD
jgi:DNA-binding transcriptional regulator GbsR (MarR family)